MPTITVRPNADYLTVGAWTRSSGAENWPLLDDTPVDNASEVTSPGTGAIGLTVSPYIEVDVATPAVPVGAQVRWVKVRARARSNAVSAQMWLGVANADAVSDLQAVQVDTTYRDWSATWTVSPSGLPWTVAELATVRAHFGPNWNDPLIRVSEVYVDVEYNEPPTATVNGPAEGSTVSTTTRPSVTWAYADPEGNMQERARVKVFTAAQYGIVGFDPETSPVTYDSGELLTALAVHALPVDLVNGTTYRAYVKAADAGSGGRYGVWDSNTFTVSIDPPAPPIVTATVDNTLARIALALQGLDNELTVNHASLETDTAGWAAAGSCTIARSTAQAAHGAASLAVTSTAAADCTVRTGNTAATGGIAGAAGQTYTVTAEFRAAVTARNCWVAVNCFSSVAASVGTAAGAVVVSTTAGWTQATLTFVAPPGTAIISVRVHFTAGAIGEVQYVDKIKLAPGTSTTWTRGGVVPLQTLLVERSADGGLTWSTVRGASAVNLTDPGQTSLVYDYEAPSGVACQYRARSVATDGAFSTAGANSATSSVTWTAAASWLKVPQTPALNQTAAVVAPSKSSRPERQGVFAPLGRARKVVVRGELTGEEGELELRFFDETAYVAFEALRAAQQTVLHQDVAGVNRYIALGAVRSTDFVTPYNDAAARYRKVSIGYTEVDVP